MKSEVYNQSICIVIKAADLYYMQKKSQKEISQILKISGPTVSRLLKRAKDEEVVAFILQNPYIECLELENKLKLKYKLKEVIVVPSKAGALEADEEETKKAVALEGARYIQRVLTSRDNLGIAWGGTMYHLIQYLNPCRKTEANFIALHGSLSCCDYELDVRTLVLRMAMSFGGNHYSIVSEGLMNSSERVKLLCKEDRFKRIFELFEHVTISVSGIGSLYPKADSPLSRMQYLKPDEFAELQEKGVYGDLMLRFFDMNGQECESSLKDRTLAIDMDVYRKIPCKVIACSGTKKAWTLRAALKGGLIDVLIVDYLLAKAICDNK